MRLGAYCETPANPKISSDYTNTLGTNTILRIDANQVNTYAKLTHIQDSGAVVHFGIITT